MFVSRAGVAPALRRSKGMLRCRGGERKSAILNRTGHPPLPLKIAYADRFASGWPRPLRGPVAGSFVQRLRSGRSGRTVVKTGPLAADMPGPCGRNDRIEIRMRHVATQPRLGASGRGPKRRGIAGTSRSRQNRHRLAGDALDRRDNGANGMANAGAEIERVRIAAGQQFPQGPNMGIGKVGHMNVVADGGAVGGRIVGAENIEMRQLTRAAIRARGMRWGSGS